MTENDAKATLCPKAKSFDASHSTAIRTSAALCVGSACMAWEWSEPKRTAAFLEAVQARMQAQKKPNFNTAVQEVYAETGGQFARVEGDCGLKARAQ